MTGPQPHDERRRLAKIIGDARELLADPGQPGERVGRAARCGAVGVELGACDRRIVAWLSGWEPQTCAVVAGLIDRARAALTDAQRETLADALGDALSYREPAGSCADWEANSCPPGDKLTTTSVHIRPLLPIPDAVWDT